MLFPIQVTPSVISVSYTHLDVYKRQVYAVFQLEGTMPEVTSELAISVSKIDLSDLLITNVPTNTSVYYLSLIHI